MLYFYKTQRGMLHRYFEGMKLMKFTAKKQRLWIEILNKSFEETVEIKRNKPLGFLVIKPEHLKFKYEMAKKKKKADQKNLSTCKPKMKKAT